MILEIAKLLDQIYFKKEYVGCMIYCSYMYPSIICMLLNCILIIKSESP